MSLHIVDLTSNSQLGALVKPISASTLVSLVQQGPAALLSYVNQEITALESQQPEHTRMRLDVSGLVNQGPFGWQYDWAPQIVQAINQQFGKGQIKDISTGEKVLAWPEYPAQIAWTEGTGKLRLRWQKGQPFLQYIIVALILFGLGFLLYQALRAAHWNLDKAISSLTNPSAPGPGSSITIGGVPLADILLGGGLLIAVPFALRHIASGERSAAAIEAATKKLRGGK